MGAARGLPHSVAVTMRDVLAILEHWGEPFVC